MKTELAFQLTSVTREFPHFKLGPIDLELERGRIMGFIGPNGAGKSTALKIMMGLTARDQGEVAILGHAIPAGQVAAKWEVGFASEDMNLYRNQSLGWHIQFIQSVYPAWDNTFSTELLRRFDLNLEQPIKAFSHGQRVKAGLLLILARRPKLLILDEPTTGLDPVARREVMIELLEVVKDEERSVLFSSHNTQDVEQFSDQITFIDRGRIIESQDKESFLENWRRIRFEIQQSAAIPEFKDTVEIRRDGSFCTLITRRFQPEILPNLEEGGARIMGIEPLSLEEIFVTNVLASRTGGDQ